MACESATPQLPAVRIHPRIENNSEEVIWAGVPYKSLKSGLDELYNDQVMFKKNLFKLPSGKAGKDFINEMTFWLRQFNKNTKLNAVAFKVLMILRTLLLQKPSAKSKAKQHTLSLERRLQLWKTGDIKST